jgi:diguanylate cyclase (GGDEF)-like protein
MEDKGIFHSFSEKNLSAYFASSHDGVFLINDCLELIYANATMQEWLGIKMQAASNNHYNLLDLVALGDSKTVFLQNSRSVLSGTPSKFRCMIPPLQNEAIWLEISLQRAPYGRLLGIARDIGGHKHELEQLQSRFGKDELTGFLNRNEFMRMLEDMHLPMPGREHALLMIELEHFGIVNDMCGLAAGDALLCQIAEIMRRLQGKQDVVARMGGKKFGMLRMSSNMDTAYAKACEIRDTLTAFKFEHEDKKFEVGVSIGFTSIRQDTESNKQSLVSEADSACHYARNMGHNRIHAYSPNGNNAYRQQESEWISRIASAFENERFQLFYQNIRQIESSSESENHHEILLRMLDENGEYVTPGEFIPAAEKFNLMPLIDRWVIRTLFARNAILWCGVASMQEDMNVPLSLCCINISGSSLNDDYFPEFLRDQVALHNVPPRAVCFEITETVAVKDLDKASHLIKSLRADGFRFALDDFGKGMSSFSYLKALPVDFLKIDGSLVQNIDTNKVDHCMVEAINKIAQEMGIKTIAEYVKSQKVIDMLQTMGVNYAQGYGIHHPEPLL